MTIDTLAYAKSLESAGLSREAAEAQVAAFAQHVLPEIVTPTYLDQKLEQLEHRLTVRMVGFMLAIVGLMDGVLFALLRVVPPPH